MLASEKAAVEANDVYVKGVVCAFLVRKEAVMTLGVSVRLLSQTFVMRV